MVAFLTVWIPIIQGIVTIGALIAGAVIAWLGLSTWRQQMVAKTDYDLAKRLLVGAYRLRDAVWSARMGKDFASMFDQPELKAEHKQRMEALQEAARAYEVELLEANALWDEDTNGPLRGFLMPYHELWIAFDAFYIVPDEDPKKQEKFRSLLFTEGEDWANDAYSQKLKRRLARVEEVLRPKLMLRRKANKKAK